MNAATQFADWIKREDKKGPGLRCLYAAVMMSVLEWKKISWYDWHDVSQWHHCYCADDEREESPGSCNNCSVYTV